MNDRVHPAATAAQQLPTPQATAIVAELARQVETQKKATGTVPVIQDGRPFLILRDADGKERVEYLDGRRTAPDRNAGTVELADADSLIAYWKRFAGSHSSMFAESDPVSFTAILNESTPSAPNWRDWRAKFVPETSKEWGLWTARNKQHFKGNEEFAYFIEDNAPDVIRPAAADFVEIALNFRVKSGMHFTSALRLEDGNCELAYTETVDGSTQNAKGNKIKIPENFTIEIPVFDGLNAKKYRIEAYFRYRVAGGALTIWYQLVRPHKVMEQAFKDLVAQIAKESKAEILFGTP